MKRGSAPILCLLGVLLLFGGPMLRGDLIGLPSVDTFDTVLLRALFADAVFADEGRSTLLFFPTGFSPLGLMPNRLDHLLSLPFVSLFSFPLADNLWWVCVLWANAVAGWALGVRVGGRRAGPLGAGVVLLAEPHLRELNLHHAPQMVLFPGLLFLRALLAQPGPSRWRAAAWWAVAGWAYWYGALFFACAALPLIRLRAWRAWVGPGLLALGLVLPVLLPSLLSWGSNPLLGGFQPAPGAPSLGLSGLPLAAQFSAAHGLAPHHLLGGGFADVSSRLSVVLVLAGVVGVGRGNARTRRAGLWMLVLAGVLVLGPFLRSPEGLVLLGGEPVPLPFGWMGRLHSTLARLTWPERWGVLFAPGFVLLLARSRWSLGLLLAFFLETLTVSANLPVASVPIVHQTCWSELRSLNGAILELPLRRSGLQAARLGVHQRLHGRPLVNPGLLPPGVPPPPDWAAWASEQPLLQFVGALEDGAWPTPPTDLAASARAAGIGAVAIDVEPGGVLAAGGENRLLGALRGPLGAPIDLGCAQVFWLEQPEHAPHPHQDGLGWREARRAELETLVVPPGPYLIQVLWRQDLDHRRRRE